MTKCVFFGASTVEGAGASIPAKRFSTLVCKTLGWEEVNLGIGGTCVVGRDTEGQVTDENSGLGRVPDVLDAAPDRVLVLYGANDFVQSLPIGNHTQFQQGTFLWDWDTLVRGLLFQLKPEQITLSTCFYRADATTPNTLGLVLQDYNQIIKNVGERHALRVLDAYADAGMDSDNWHKLSDDGVHPNDAGHECLAAFFNPGVPCRAMTGSGGRTRHPTPFFTAHRALSRTLTTRRLRHWATSSAPCCLPTRRCLT